MEPILINLFFEKSKTKLIFVYPDDTYSTTNSAFSYYNCYAVMIN